MKCLGLSYPGNEKLDDDINQGKTILKAVYFLVAIAIVMIFFFMVELLAHFKINLCVSFISSCNKFCGLCI